VQAVKIVQTVTATNMAELRARRERARGADLVELRLDGVQDLDVRGALAGRAMPVIVTCRAAWEGGRFEGAEDDRLRILSDAAAAGAEYVDVEWKADRRHLDLGRARVVLSHHDFAGVPGDVAARLEAMRRDAPRAIVKLAAMPASPDDLVALADASALIDGDRMVIGMGSVGLVSRTCPWLFHSCWTFAGTAAPGQLPFDEFERRYRVRTGTAARRLFALTGAPLAHSASPAMHNAAFAALGTDACYVPIESRDHAGFLRAAERFGIEGASVTAPLKLGWERAGVALEPDAHDAGAVNTLKRDGTRWIGRNFDVAGFLDPLDARGLELSGLRALVLGTGGAARAALRALQSRGARVFVAGRRRAAAAALAGAFGAEIAPDPLSGRFDLLVNATPVGTHPDVEASPINFDGLDTRIVYDLVYNPADTALVRAARARGAATIGGLDMLVGQARRQFEYWTGVPAPVDVMQRAAADFLGALKES
jgi:3-dehydroquinate dehydratase/shikimate dehydrogenase